MSLRPSAEASRDALVDGGAVTQIRRTSERPAHAACYACADRSDVLRVWITAPASTRASRLASALGLSDKEAAKSLRQSDAAHANYLKRVYSVDEESPDRLQRRHQHRAAHAGRGGGSYPRAGPGAPGAFSADSGTCARLAADLPCHVDYPGQGSECPVAASVVNQG